MKFTVHGIGLLVVLFCNVSDPTAAALIRGRNTGLCSGISVSGAKYFKMIDGQYSATEVKCDSSPGIYTWEQDGAGEQNFIYYFSDAQYWYIGAKMCDETFIARAYGSYDYPYDVPAGSWEEMNTNGDWESNPQLNVSCSAHWTTETTTLSTTDPGRCDYVSVYGAKYFYIMNGKYPTTDLMCASSCGRYTWEQTNTADPNFIYYLSDSAFWYIGTKLCKDTFIARAYGSAYQHPYDVPAGSWQEKNGDGDWEANPDLFVVCDDQLSTVSRVSTTPFPTVPANFSDNCHEVTTTGALVSTTNGIYPLSYFNCSVSSNRNIWEQTYTAEPNFVYSDGAYWYIGINMCEFSTYVARTTGAFGQPYDVPLGSWQEYVGGIWQNSPNIHLSCSS